MTSNQQIGIQTDSGIRESDYINVSLLRDREVKVTQREDLLKLKQFQFEKDITMEQAQLATLHNTLQHK